MRVAAHVVSHYTATDNPSIMGVNEMKAGPLRPLFCPPPHYT